ncbi:hypothetical protein Pcinc_040621 [Petrolisthes cinctipes]|uniref:Uncharacterized protein n=1 Tax=Petrolisthes cinctipes TaxID=88211 RepID=A0AAE1EKL8_PETCI|nr:hypothetical protein Pcinc_040621 [Petrolisthes cinctipes]
MRTITANSTTTPTAPHPDHSAITHKNTSHPHHRCNPTPPLTHPHHRSQIRIRHKTVPQIALQILSLLQKKVRLKIETYLTSASYNRRSKNKQSPLNWQPRSFVSLFGLVLRRLESGGGGRKGWMSGGRIPLGSLARISTRVLGGYKVDLAGRGRRERNFVRDVNRNVTYIPPRAE